jgi:hypothetical protein
MSASAALVDEVAEQGIPYLFEVDHRPRRLGQFEERLAAGGIGFHSVDQRLQRGGRSHAS